MFGAGAVALSARDAGNDIGSEATAAPEVASPAAPSTGVTGVIAILQKRLAAVPGDWQSLATLGSAYVEQARISGDPSYYPKAQEALERSLRLDGTQNFAAMSGLGALAAARHDFTAALRWADRGLAINPDNSTLYGVRGDALVELGRYDDAAVAVQRMADLRPGLPAYARASYLRELHGDVPGALRLMDMALREAGSPADGAFAAYHVGELHENAGRLDLAERAYRDAASRDSSALPPREGLARIAAARGKTAEAIRSLEALVAERPLPQYAAALTDLYVVAGRPDDAARQGELLAVQRKLLIAAGVNTDLEMALYSADNRVDVPQAVAAARQEWSRRHSIHIADALAWALYADGKFAEAKTYADKALALGTRSASFHFHRGMIERSLGRRSAALADLRTALAINPHFSVRRAVEAHRAVSELSR
jgi:tetratricopeptide (TPR) repeat protein